MKEISKIEKSKFEDGIYAPILFGLFLLGCVGYCIGQSDSDCLVYLGRGLKKTCGNDRNDGMVPLAFLGGLAGIFLILGLRNLKAKLKQRGHNETI